MDNDDEKRRFMVNATSEDTSATYEKIDVPIICLDSDDDDLETDNDCKFFFNHLRVDDKLGPVFDTTSRSLDSLPIRYEDDSGESETRKFDITFSVDSKRSKLCGNENPMVRSQDFVERNNRVSQQRKRNSMIIREDIERENRVLARRKRKLAAALEAAKTHSQRENKVRNISESKVETLIDVPLVSDQEDTQSVEEISELEVEMLVSDHQEDNNVSEGRKRRFVETEAAETSREDVLVEPEDEDVDETSRESQRKKNVLVMDKDYMSYLEWLVDSRKDSTTTKQMENLQKDQSDLDPETTPKESKVVPEKDLLVEVKVEPDLESCSDDDSDIIVVSGSPFRDGEGTPFVTSRSELIDLEKKSKENESSKFKTELMDILKRPYDEAEFLKLSGQASEKKPKTKCREFRKGREKSCVTDELGQSFLETYSDFYEVYKLVAGVDKRKALALLRGFFFYLENVSHEGAFEPWNETGLAMLATIGKW